jgi:hypothetical protein
MHGHEKSDPAVVGVKSANKDGRPSAERMERRACPRESGGGNASQQRTHRAQNWASVTQALDRGSLPPDLIRWERRKAAEEGTVHRTPASRQRRYAADGIPRAEARCRPWCGWPDVDGLRGRPRAEARGPARSGPPGSIPAAAVPPDGYTEGGRQTAASGDCCPGGQGLSPD